MRNDSYRSEKFIFRVIGASDELVENVLNVLGDSLVRVNNYYKNKDIVVVSVEIKQGVDYSEFVSLVKNSKIEKKKCGLFASLVTDRDSSGISVPDFVLDIFFEIGYSLDFSYTFV
ncbi:hypothetical protein [Solidesulfovibrio sp.]|uniref:hypothetical protein n=1 Tax=Solidesulfovibrio sp. TaxID=2910990 RepID=UPI00262C8AD4|nr:hypothetical protein [Solidesulfovibrio sp.]